MRGESSVGKGSFSKLVINHNWFAHEHELRIMDDIMSLWVDICDEFWNTGYKIVCQLILCILGNVHTFKTIWQFDHSNIMSCLQLFINMHYPYIANHVGKNVMKIKEWDYVKFIKLERFISRFMVRDYLHGCDPPMMPRIFSYITTLKKSLDFDILYTS